MSWKEKNIYIYTCGSGFLSRSTWQKHRTARFFKEKLEGLGIRNTIQKNVGNPPSSRVFFAMVKIVNIFRVYSKNVFFLFWKARTASYHFFSGSPRVCKRAHFTTHRLQEDGNEKQHRHTFKRCPLRAVLFYLTPKKSTSVGGSWSSTKNPKHGYSGHFFTIPK